MNEEEEKLREIASAAAICAAMGQLIQRMEAETDDPSDPVYRSQLFFFRSIYRKYKQIQQSEKVYKDCDGNLHLKRGHHQQFNVN